MSFHHIAIATRDLEATHRFYDTGNGELFAVRELRADPQPQLARPPAFYAVHEASAVRTS
jgi:catechol 2,3-dioxygenase-like lactoylglutathione lyase family enzyme